MCVFVTVMEHKLLEERSAKQQLENRLMQLEKENSGLDCDYKQAKHELQELRSLKEKLTEEVYLSVCFSCLAVTVCLPDDFNYIKLTALECLVVSSVHIFSTILHNF